MGKLSMYWLCYMLIPINLYGDFIADKLGIQPIYINTLTIIAYALISVSGKKLRLSRRLWVFLIIGGILFVIHVGLVGNVTNEIKQFMYVILFILIASHEREETYYLFKKVILFITIPMSLDALIHIPMVRRARLNIYNIRLYVMLDKPYYTIVFSIAIVLLVNKLIIEKAKKRKVAYMIWIAVLVYIQFFAIQSKTSVFAVIVSLLFQFAVTNVKSRKKLIVAGSTIILLLLIIFAVSEFNIQLPGFLQQMINFVTNNYSQADRVYYTYIVRMEITRIAFNVFLSNPVFGIGFKNYFEYVTHRNLQKFSARVIELESSWLEVIVSGGIIYLCLMVWLIATLLKRTLNQYKAGRASGDAFAIVLCITILFFGNDYINTFFWSVIGIVWSYAFSQFLTAQMMGEKIRSEFQTIK